MIESDFTRAVHKKIPATVRKWKINDNFFGGVSDAFYRRLDGVGSPTWVEYKYIKALPKRESTLIVPKLSAQQRVWLEEAEAAGEKAFVIVGYKSKGVVYALDELDGITREEFQKRLQSYQQLADVITASVQM